MNVLVFAEIGGSPQHATALRIFAALCIEHGVTELVTGDRDFHRFPGLRIVDPFVS